MNRNDYDLVEKYLDIKEAVIENGYEYEIEWQENTNIKDIDERSFLKEFAWVVLSSGFRESILRTKYSQISMIFNYWNDIVNLNLIKSSCKAEALKYFNNEKKIDSICNMIEFIDINGFKEIEENILLNNLSFFYQFKFLGPITTIHLFKNLGVSIVKPDRHLKRISQALGFNLPAELCNKINNYTGDDLKVIDLVYWRYATIEPDYINILTC